MVDNITVINKILKFVQKHEKFELFFVFANVNFWFIDYNCQKRSFYHETTTILIPFLKENIKLHTINININSTNK